MRRLMAVLGLMFFLPLLISCGSSGKSSSTDTGGGSGQVVLRSITISPSSASIPAGTTQQFAAMGTYSDGSHKDLTMTAQWSCLLPNLATVSSNAPTQGVATGISPGVALITASVGSVTNNAQLTVNTLTVTSVAVSPATATIGVGNQKQFTATATFSDMSTQDVTNLATWSFLPGSSGASITSNSGLAIGQSSGVSTVTATFGGQSATLPATLTVDLSNLVSISVLPSTAMIANNTQAQFTALGTFNDGSTSDVTSLVSSWASSDNATATIGSGGIATGKSPGIATVTATVPTSSSTLTASATLNVSSAQLQSIALLPLNASIAPATQLPYTAVGVFSDSTTQILAGAQVAWSLTSISPSSSSSIDSKGIVMAGQAAESDNVNVVSSALLGSIPGSTLLSVTSATLSSVSLTPATAIIGPGTSLNYSATGSFSDGSSQDITAQTGIKSSLVGVATVASPVVTGQGIGRAVITGIAKPALTKLAPNPINPALASLVVAAATQFSVAISPATIQIANQTSTQLKATGTFVDGTTQDLTTIVNWSSSAPSVATVGFQTGTVSGLAPGQSTVTATLGTATATTQVTVTNATLTSIALLPANPTVALASSTQFAATGNFSDGSTQPLAGAAWSSSSPAVGIVSNSGMATATSAGAAIITATFNGVSGSTNLTVQ